MQLPRIRWTVIENAADAAPFGIQQELLSEKVVDEVLLGHREWQHFYRIPAGILREIETTMAEGRKIFNVDENGCLMPGPGMSGPSLVEYKVDFTG